jgi:outer membrane receptor protein involved in Fe transport
MAEAERVMVTGSNIPTAAEVGPNPVQTLDRQTIDQSGERTVEELIKNLPVANANGVPTSNNIGGNGAGASSISLRGLDPGATLVLINGHRVASFPVGAVDGSQLFFDIASLPKAAIDSIEILKDGASAIYGADAIAGVVNIKLRHDYNGAEASVEYGNTIHKDSSEFSSSLLFGVGKGDTNITGVVDYYHRDSIFDRDHAYSINRFAPSSNSSPFNLELSRAAVIAAGGNPDPGLGDTFFGHSPFLGTGSAPASAYTYTEGRSSGFNPNAYRSALPDTQRYGEFITIDHKVFGDAMVVYADVFYQHVDTHYEGASPNTGDFAQPFGTILAIPPHAPGPTLGGPTYAETGVPLGAYNPFNPFQQIISGGSRARLFEFGNTFFDNYTDSVFTTGGVRGDKLFHGAWGYDAAFRFSRVYNATDWTLPFAPRFNRILNAADPIFDPASSEYIGTMIPYNPFGDYRRPIINNYRVLDFTRIHTNETDLGTLASFDLNIYTTELFKLPAGGVGLAFGGQFQRESDDQNADPRQTAANVISGGQYFPGGGSREEYAAYAEASIPIFSPSFVAPGFHALEVTAAIRYEQFLNNDSNVAVPKFGMRWQPFDDSLTLRATWGEGFKEPNVAELFAPSGAFFSDVFDPVTNTFLPEFKINVVGNPQLQPEDSRSFSGGIVYTPKFVTGLTATVDLWDVETTGWINLNFNPTDVLRRIAEGHALPGEIARRDANGNLTFLQLTFQNTGSQKVRGADFSLQYQLQTSLGMFTSLTQATFLDSYQFASVPGETEHELRSSGVDAFSDDAYLKWKGSSRLSWQWHGIGLAATANFRDGFHEFDIKGNQHWVQQTWFFDLQASYNFDAIIGREDSVPGVTMEPAGKDNKNTIVAPTANYRRPFWKEILQGATIAIGCTNVFDHDPPTSFDNYPRFIYDPTGRFVYFSITKRFW